MSQTLSVSWPYGHSATPAARRPQVRMSRSRTQGPPFGASTRTLSHRAPFLRKASDMPPNLVHCSAGEDAVARFQTNAAPATSQLAVTWVEGYDPLVQSILLNLSGVEPQSLTYGSGGAWIRVRLLRRSDKGRPNLLTAVSRGDETEGIWNDASVPWKLYRAPELQFQDCAEGLGLFASENLPSDPPGNWPVVLKVPKESCIIIGKMTYGPWVFPNWKPGRRLQVALAIPTGITDPNILLAIASIDCFEGAHGRLWENYMKIAMEPLLRNDATIPLLMPDVLLDHVGDALITYEARQAKQALEELAEKYYPDLQNNPLLFGAVAYAFSRSREAAKLVPGCEEGYVLVPFWELVNHSEDANCESDVTTTGVQLEVIVPELRKGDELTWYYGEIPNAGLFQRYGFSVPRILRYDFLEVRGVAVPSQQQSELEAFNEDLMVKVNSGPYPAYLVELRSACLNNKAKRGFVDTMRYFRQLCDMLLSGITSDADFEALKPKVSARQFQAVAQYRRVRRDLINGAIKVLDDFLP